MLIHAGTNLINDYYDLKKGADTQDSLGPNRALKEGMLTPSRSIGVAIVCFALGSGLGLYLVATRGLFILYLGIFSVLAGWFYTAGPAAFAYTGLGEIVVFIFMGPVIVLGQLLCDDPNCLARRDLDGCARWLACRRHPPCQQHARP